MKAVELQKLVKEYEKQQMEIETEQARVHIRSIMPLMEKSARHGHYEYRFKDSKIDDNCKKWIDTLLTLDGYTVTNALDGSMIISWRPKN